MAHKKRAISELFCFCLLLLLSACKENKSAPYKDNTEIPSKVMRDAGNDTVDTGNVAPQEP
jgi:hypothetical protein